MFNVKGYDDIVIEIDNALGTSNKFIYINLTLDNQESRTMTVTSFFNETSPQKLFLTGIRQTSDVFDVMIGGNKTAYNVVRFNNTDYKNKTSKIYIGIQDASQSTNKINQANIKVSGRKRYE